MKTKKPILIICSAALTLALALPFMGVFAFAEEDTYDIVFSNQRSNNVMLYYSDGSDLHNVTVYSNSSVTVSFLGNVTYSVYVVAGQYRGYLFYRLPDTSGRELSGVSSNPTVFDSESLPETIYISSSDTSTFSEYYFSVSVPLPDPLEPVSDGLEASLDIFGQVIDYVVNTPSVAVFVALSVAAFAIVPAGIVIIKKLIKGY